MIQRNKLLTGTLFFIILMINLLTINSVSAVTELHSYSFNSQNSDDETGSLDGTDTGIVYSNTGGVSFNISGTGGYYADADTGDDINFGNGVLPSQLSFSFWYKPDSFTNDGSNTEYVIDLGFDYANHKGAGLVQRATAPLGALKSYVYDGESSNLYSEESTTQLIINNWHHLVYIYNSDGNLTLYINGDLEYGVIHGDGSTDDSVLDWTIFERNDGTAGIDGKIDEFKIFSGGLTNEEVKNLFNYNSLVSNIKLNMSVSFTNNTHLHDSTPSFTGLYTDVDDNDGNCTLIINNSGYGFQTTTNGTIVNITANNTLTDGVYNFKFQCFDNNSNEYNSTLYDFVIDTLSPVWTIRTINTDNITKFDREIVTNITFNDSLSDTYVFGYNVTSYFPNGSVWFSDSAVNLTTTKFNYTEVKNITATMPNGTYSINYYGEDDHTAKSIKDYVNYKIEKGFIFYTESANIGVYSKDFEQLINYETIKLLDRYSFNFEYYNNKKTRTYTLISSEDIYDRSKLYSFPSFVTGNQWLDFNTDNLESYKLKSINSKEFEITITTIKDDSKTIFKSLGGLNSVNETYTFKIGANQAPIIDFTSPNQTMSMYDGYNQSFYMNGTDFDNDTLTYTYYYDGVLQHTGQNYTFLAPYNAHGEHNITGILSDGSTKTDSYYWNVTIVNLNRPPVTTNLTRIPLTTWYENINANLYCSGYDIDNETQPVNWSVEIQYKSGLLWQDLTETFYNTNIWTSNMDLTGMSGDTLSFRCRINDGFEWGNYIILVDEVTIHPAYSAMGNISIYPSGTNKDYGIKVSCGLKTIGTIPQKALLYNIDSYYNGTWHNQSDGLFEDTIFNMAKIDYGENVKFRCAVSDGVTTTNYTTGEDVTRTKDTYFFMFGLGTDEVKRAYKPYTKGLMIDFSTQANISINASFVDCNNDGYYDYYFKYDTHLNKTKEYFTCINRPGIITHTIGVLVDKQGTNNLFCDDKTGGYCIIKKTYEVIVK